MSDRSRRESHKPQTSLLSLPPEILGKILNLRAEREGVLLLQNDGRSRYVHPHLLTGSMATRRGRVFGPRIIDSKNWTNTRIKDYLSSRNSFGNRVTYNNVDVIRNEKGLRVFAREKHVNPRGPLMARISGVSFGGPSRIDIFMKESGRPHRIIRSGVRKKKATKRWVDGRTYTDA